MLGHIEPSVVCPDSPDGLEEEAGKLRQPLDAPFDWDSGTVVTGASKISPLKSMPFQQVPPASSISRMSHSHTDNTCPGW